MYSYALTPCGVTQPIYRFLQKRTGHVCQKVGFIQNDRLCKCGFYSFYFISPLSEIGWSYRSILGLSSFSF